MMFAGICQVDRVPLFRDQRESKDIGVILGLPVEIGGLIAGMRYLPHSDHCGYSLSFWILISRNSNGANLDGAANERALIRLAGLGRRRAAPQEDLDRKLHRLVDLFAFWG